MGLSGCYGWQEHAQAIPLISSQMWVESHAVYAFFIAWGRLHAIEEYTVFANYGSKNRPWLFGRCLCPFVPLCFAAAVAYNNQIPCDCCADVTFYMVGGRSIMACAHLWKCPLNFVLRLFQVASGCFSVSSSLFYSISARPATPRTGIYLSTGTHDRFNKPSGIINSAVNIGKT